MVLKRCFWTHRYTMARCFLRRLTASCQPRNISATGRCRIREHAASSAARPVRRRIVTSPHKRNAAVSLQTAALPKKRCTFRREIRRAFAAAAQPANAAAVVALSSRLQTAMSCFLPIWNCVATLSQPRNALFTMRWACRSNALRSAMSSWLDLAVATTHVVQVDRSNRLAVHTHIRLSFSLRHFLSAANWIHVAHAAERVLLFKRSRAEDASAYAWCACLACCFHFAKAQEIVRCDSLLCMPVHTAQR